MHRLVLLSLILGTLPACSQEVAQKKTPTDLSVLPKLVEAINKADKVTLLEGLPHQRFEANLLADELKAKKTIEISKYPFYSEALALKETDEKSLRELVTTPDSFSKFLGEKRCGGFHPDYALDYQVGLEKCHVLICFGCHEVIVVGPKQAVRADIRENAYKAFKTTLEGYQKNRPKKKDD